MRFKDLLLPVALAVLTTFLVRQFILKDSGASIVSSSAHQAGRQEAPSSEEVRRPLNFEIDFTDSTKKKPAQNLVEIETDLGKYVFSNYGGSLERLEFKHDVNKNKEYLGTIFPLVAEDRERRCFMLSLPEKTPYYYDFVGKVESEKSYEVSYKVDSELAHIVKKFIIYKDSYLVDVNVTVVPKAHKLEFLTARLQFPSPIPCKSKASEKNQNKKSRNRSPSFPKCTNDRTSHS